MVDISPCGIDAIEAPWAYSDGAGAVEFVFRCLSVSEDISPRPARSDSTAFW